VKFVWDPRKDRENRAKHGVAFTEASTVFDDLYATTIDDPDHSVGEHRYLTTGYSHQQRLLIVSHTEEAEDLIRIIGARRVTNVERHAYEEGE
jgi:uncharacterized DUF497 family protein